MRLFLLALLFAIVTATTRTRTEREEKLRQIIRHKLQAYEKELDIALQLTLPSSRTKRATITADNPMTLGRQRRKIASPRSDEGGFLVRSVFRLSPLEHTLDVHALLINNSTFMLTLETKGTQVVLYKRNAGLKPVEVVRKEVPPATLLEVVEIDKQWFVLPLVHNASADAGSPLLRLDVVRRSFTQIQLIQTPNAAAVLFWQGSGEVANSVWLGVGPEENGEVGCYRWQGGYFDRVSSLPANNPQAIAHFNILNNDYLAVANFMDNSGSTSVHSEVFKYVDKESRFLIFQRVRTFGAKDIRHFSFKQGERVEHFLAIANHATKDEQGRLNYRVKSLIMKFAEHRFVPFKSFYTHGALQFLPVTLDDKFYLLLLEIERLIVFQYNGWSFVQVTRIELPALPQDALRLRPFIHENKPDFAVGSSLDSFTGGIYSVQFDARNDYSSLASGLEKWCLAAQRRLNQVDLPTLATFVHLAPKIHDEQLLLNKSLTFMAPLSASSLQANRMKYRGIEFDDKLGNKLVDLAKDGLEGQVAVLEERISKAVFRNNNHEIEGKVIFDQLEYLNPNIDTESSELGVWNGVDVAPLINGLVFTNAPLALNSLSAPSVQFEKGVDVNSLNGVPLEDYALKDQGGVFTGRNSFTQETTLGGNIHVNGKFAGVDFSRPNFLLAQGNQTLHGIVRVSNGNVEQLYTHLLNGQNITRFFEDAVPLHGDAVITGPHLWKKLDVNEVFIDEGGLINGQDLNRLFSTAIYTRGKETQQFTATTRMRTLITDSVATSSFVNGKYDLSKDFVSVRNGSYEFGELVLSEGGEVMSLNVLSKLGQLDGGGDFGLVLKGGDGVQWLKNKKLKGAHFAANVVADTHFAGVNLKTWESNQRIELTRSTNIRRKFFVHGNISAPSVRVNKRFLHNGTDLLPLLATIAARHSQTLPSNCQLVFQNLKVVGKTEVNKDVNGVRPSQWLLKNASEIVNVGGTKTFLGDVTLENDATAKALFSKGQNILVVLSDLLIQGMNQTITAPTAFLNLLQVKTLECSIAVVGGVRFDSLLFAGGEQIVNTTTNFGYVDVKQELQVKGNAEIYYLNGQNLTKDILDTLRTRSAHTQIIQGEYSFQEGLVVTELQTDGLVDEENIGLLFASLVRKDRKTLLELKSLSFAHGLTTPSFFYTGTLNSIPDTLWGRLWLLQSGNQTVTSPTRFENGLQVEKGLWTKNGRVGTVDIAKLRNNAIPINQAAQLGHLQMNGLHAEALQLGSNARLNGMKFGKDLLIRNSDNNVVKGLKVFEAGMDVRGNVETKLLDGTNVNAALHFLNNPNSALFKRHSLIVQGNLKLVNEPRVLQQVNGAKWTELLRKVWFTNQPVTLIHRPHFKYVIFSGGASLKGNALNGVNLEQLLNSYVSRSKDQKWTGNVVFKGGAEIDFLRATDLQTGGEVNHGLLPTFLASVLTNGTNQTITARWTLDALAAHRVILRRGNIINGMDLDKAFLTLHGHNRLSQPVNVASLTTNELQLNPQITLISNINLTQWMHNALKTKGNQVLHVPLQINSLLHAQDLRIGGQLDGVDVENILLKRGNQVIEGRMEVSPELEAPKGIHLKGPFNNQNLNATFGNLVRKSENEPLVVGGGKQFLQPVRADHITTEAQFLGQNLSQIINQYHSGTVIPPSINFRAYENYEALTAFTQHALTIANRRAVWLEYFVLSQSIEVRNLVATRLLLGTPSPSLLFVQANQREIELLFWVYSTATELFQRQQSTEKLRYGRVVDVLEDEFSLVLAVSSVSDRSISISTPKAKNHVDIFKAFGLQSRVFILRQVENRGWMLIKTVHGKDFGPLGIVEVGGDSCLFITALDGASSWGHLLCGESYTLLQSTSLNFPTLVSSLEVGNQSLLVVATGGSSEGVVEVWSGAGGVPFYKQSCISVFNPVDMDAILGPNNNPFLVIASGPSSPNYLGAVFIYWYSQSKGQFEKTQTLEVDDPKEVRLHVLHPSKELLLFVLTSNKLLLFKFHGVAGWSEEHGWASDGADSLELGDFSHEGMHKGQVILSSGYAIRVYSAIFKGLSSNPAENYYVDDENEYY